MEQPTKKQYFITFTILCLAVSVLMGSGFIGEYLYVLTEEWIGTQEAGVYRWLSWLFCSEWTDVLVQYIFVLGMPYVAAYLLLFYLPKDRREPVSFSLQEFMVCLVMALGLGYVLNFAGLVVGSVVSLFTNKTIGEMNPVIDMMSNLKPGMLIYACILGPFMEELMFRGLLLKRARRFGDRTAVIFCAVLFGLMHGNLTQFLYATAIGVVLGYVAVRTNSIRYNVLLHMAVNSFSTLILVGEAFLESRGFGGLAVLSMAGFLPVTVFLVVCAILFLIWYGPSMNRRLLRANGIPSAGKLYVYVNPGFFLYALICGIEILFYLF